MNRKAYLDDKLLHFFLILILIFVLVETNNVCLFATEKPAANQTQRAKLQDDKKKQSDEKTISDENVKLFLDQIEIYGQIAKPQTVFIIPGTDPRVDGLRIDRHFFSHIFRPVEKSTLHRVRIKQGKDKDHILW